MPVPDRRGSPFESAVVAAFPFLAVPLVITPLLLVVPGSWDRFTVSIVHLSVLVALAIWLAIRLAPSGGGGAWFAGRGWPENRSRFAGLVALVVIVTGVIGLVTLASSAALRFQPSLQFLQLLSALDISWASAAVVVGGRRLWSSRTAATAGIIVGVACVASIWNYLRVVGLADDGGWLLDGGELMRLVIPFDMVAAIFAGFVLVRGAGRSGTHETEQASSQS